MSSISGVGAPVATPQVAPAPASQNSAPQNPPAPPSDKSDTEIKANAVQPSKPPGQGQVVYIST